MKIIFEDPSFAIELLSTIGYAAPANTDGGDCQTTTSPIEPGDANSGSSERGGEARLALKSLSADQTIREQISALLGDPFSLWCLE